MKYRVSECIYSQPDIVLASLQTGVEVKDIIETLSEIKTWMDDHELELCDLESHAMVMHHIFGMDEVLKSLDLEYIFNRYFFEEENDRTA